MKAREKPEVFLLSLKFFLLETLAREMKGRSLLTLGNVLFVYSYTFFQILLYVVHYI